MHRHDSQKKSAAKDGPLQGGGTWASVAEATRQPVWLQDSSSKGPPVLWEKTNSWEKTEGQAGCGRESPRAFQEGRRPIKAFGETAR